jgi:hypothetical protein
MNVTWALGAAFTMGLAMEKLAHCIHEIVYFRYNTRDIFGTAIEGC